MTTFRVLLELGFSNKWLVVSLDLLTQVPKHRVYLVYEGHSVRVVDLTVVILLVLI